jgi:hypothetical protein
MYLYCNLASRVLGFSMVRQIPAQFFEVFPRSSARRSRPARIVQSASPFVSTTLQLPFSATPLLSHLYKTLGGVTQQARSTLFVAVSLFRSLPHFRRCAKPHVFSRLPPLRLSCLSFSTSRLLESVTCSLFSGNTGGWGRVSAGTVRPIPKGQTSFRVREVPSTSQAGSQDVQAVCSLAQRRRRPYIQLSSLQAQGSQVNG